MEFLELVKVRYSSRAYKYLNVENEKLDYIPECVRFAHSAVNKQPWIFHIVSSEEDKGKLQQWNRTIDNRVGGHQRKAINEIIK